MNMQIPGYSAVLPVYDASDLTKPQQPQGSFPLALVAGQVSPASAEITQQAASAPSATPLQFNTSMLLDLLNAQERNSQSGTSMTISNEEVPGGLQLKGINASDAANEMIRAIGSNGELTLSDVDKFLGITTPESGAYSPEAVIARDWNKLTSGSGGRLSTSQLATAITNLSDSPAPTPAFRPSWGFRYLTS
jgi:hypothetical protein